MQSSAGPGQVSGGAVKSADRTLSILEYLASTGRKQSLGEIAVALGIPKSSLHGLLRTLTSRGWLSTDERGVLFGVGVRALLVGTSYTATDEMVRLSSDVLDRLVDELDETVHLGYLDGDQIVYLAKRDASHPLRLVSAIGVRLPATATALGKALLAQRPACELTAILPERLITMTASSIGTRDALLANLSEAGRLGYAVDNEESTPGVRCFAVAIGSRNPSDYAISCSVPLLRLDAESEQRIIAALVHARSLMAGRRAG